MQMCAETVPLMTYPPRGPSESYPHLPLWMGLVIPAETVPPKVLKRPPLLC